MEQRKRNYGIDILRIISMFFVIMLHSLGRGGVLNFYKSEDTGYYVFWFFETVAYCAVDIFGLISGYVGYTDEQKPFKMKNYVNIWLQTVFLGICTVAAFHIFQPDLVTGEDYLKSLFPVSNDLYWYLTAYTALYFFMPVLNGAVRSLDEKTVKKLLAVFFVVFCCYENLGRHFKFDRGYSFAWLALLYFAGAAIKKHGIGKDLQKRYCFIFIFLLTVLGWAFKMQGYGFEFQGLKFTDATPVAYTSPFVLIAAALYLIAFSKIQIKGVLQKLTALFAPGAFAVYIVNCHPLIWNHFMTFAFSPIRESHIVAILGAVLLFSVIFTVVCLIFDRLRTLLFKLLRISELIDKTSGLVKSLFSKIARS